MIKHEEKIYIVFSLLITSNHAIESNDWFECSKAKQHTLKPCINTKISNIYFSLYSTLWDIVEDFGIYVLIYKSIIVPFSIM